MDQKWCCVNNKKLNRRNANQSSLTNKEGIFLCGRYLLIRWAMESMSLEDPSLPDWVIKPARRPHNAWIPVEGRFA